MFLMMVGEEEKDLRKRLLFGRHKPQAAVSSRSRKKWRDMCGQKRACWKSGRRIANVARH
jgi:hypothetical protein